jgi:UDP-N-acetylglucosamine 4-epimerase
MNKERPVINGDGSYSRDFTYIENVIHANEQAAIIKNANYFEGLKKYFGVNFIDDTIVFEVFNVAFGENITLNQLFNFLKVNLSRFDPQINDIEPIYGPPRDGDIPHSLASIEKGKRVLSYNPQFDAKKGFEFVSEWYYNNYKSNNIF